MVIFVVDFLPETPPVWWADAIKGREELTREAQKSLPPWQSVERSHGRPAASTTHQLRGNTRLRTEDRCHNGHITKDKNIPKCCGSRMVPMPSWCLIICSEPLIVAISVGKQIQTSDHPLALVEHCTSSLVRHGSVLL
ncbi:unnamed protein product [Polarella glacialis]|uniref:Uncharacterized protein n=1 Tax=Polarella glacialis TaxID=89957 RepID=A0A813FLY2_POLGL|nr:unnamed protein product [Polarella glacialis]